MISYQLRECKLCGSIDELILALDRKISDISTDVYYSYLYLTKHTNRKRVLKDLVMYKHILTHLKGNPKFYSGVDYKTIISRVKSIL